MIYLNLILLFIHNYSSMISSADSLFLHNMYEESYIEYRRAFFCYSDSIKPRDFAAFIICVCESKDIKEADVFMEEWDYLEGDSLSYYRDISLLYEKLLKKDMYYEGKVMRKEFDVYRLLYKNEKDSALTIIKSISDSIFVNTAYSIIYKMRNNPLHAFYMSMILPGSGLLYLGEVKRGLSMIMINSIISLFKLYMSYKYFPYFIAAWENRTLNNGIVRYSVNMAMGEIFIFSRFTQGGSNITLKAITEYNDNITFPLNVCLRKKLKNLVF